MEIKFKGIADLEKGLAKKIPLDYVKRVVKQNGSELQEKIMRNADFKEGYQTGTTKRSITLEFTDGDLTAKTGSIDPVVNPESGLPATEYSPYVEVGTRFMEAQPFVKPAWNEQKEQFKKNMQRLVK